MLCILVVLSVIVLAAAVWAAAPAPYPVHWGRFLVPAIASVCLPMLIQVFPTAVLFLVVGLGIALGMWPRVRSRVRSFWPLAGLSVVGAYGLASLIALDTLTRFDRMREQYAFESMEDRVPTPSPVGRLYGQAADDVIASVESSLDQFRNRTRERMLRQLHEDRVKEFTSSPGFGVARILRPSEWGLKLRERPAVPVQPGFAPTPSTNQSVSATDESELWGLHHAGVVDFSNPLGFGYVKDRRHVAGFVPHAFSEVPNSAKQWQIERLELIGLLLHLEPVVYMSDKLPAMDELRAAPTRPLDTFETAGLEVIRAGQTLHIGSDGNRARMIGAIRSAKQCVGCHGGERGDLLGAFSYSLGPVEPK